MMNRMQKLFKNRKKGFTLVELIVVLVILAILLAILVPSLTKWIDKAKEKQILVDARTAYLACQTVASEAYGGIGEANVDAEAKVFTAAGIDAAKDLAGVTGTIANVTVTDNYTVDGMTYTNNGKTATLANGIWTVADETASGGES